MSVRPLRPDTDHRLGGPLPRQLAIGRDLLSKRIAALTRKCYAVLAQISLGYSPLGGR